MRVGGQSTSGLKEMPRPPFPLSYLDHPSQMPDAFWPQVPCLPLPLLQSSGLQSCGWERQGSTLQAEPQTPLLTPTLAAGISAQMAWPGATLSAYFLSCPDPETLPISRWAHSSSFSQPSLGPRLQVSSLLPPLPADGARQLHTHWATGGGGIWSQGEVREPPPFPGRPSWSSVNHFVVGTGLGSGGRGLAPPLQIPLKRTDEPAQ